MSAISAHRTDAVGAGFFETAASSGAEYVEMDVRRTGDGEIVVRHDRDVDGTVLAEATYAEVCAAAGGRVPRVREAMETLAGRARGHLDLKEPGMELEVVALAEEILGPGNYVVSTRYAASIAVIGRAFPDAVTALSVGRGLRERGAVRDLLPLGRLRECGAHWVALNHRLAHLGVLWQCARAGFPAMVWTVNQEPLMRRFLTDPRVAVLVTDRPVTAVRIREANAKSAHPEWMGG
ncbi:MAG TPA: glycerophosphodiester phosphodiesterase [Actinomadura sp.]|jgi:glycerophosphoryl diester phosphodiesterase|nr:glycerophosphodiester phosphodiesterase [Actinomadura sp.]